MDDEDHAVLESQKAAGLGQVAAGLLELDLSVHRVEDAICWSVASEPGNLRFRRVAEIDSPRSIALPPSEA